MQSCPSSRRGFSFGPQVKVRHFTLLVYLCSCLCLFFCYILLMKIFSSDFCYNFEHCIGLLLRCVLIWVIVFFCFSSFRWSISFKVSLVMHFSSFSAWHLSSNCFFHSFLKSPIFVSHLLSLHELQIMYSWDGLYFFSFEVWLDF